MHLNSLTEMRLPLSFLPIVLWPRPASGISSFSCSIDVLRLTNRAPGCEDQLRMFVIILYSHRGQIRLQWEMAELIDQTYGIAAIMGVVPY